jgi:hypothetical protein
LCLRHDAFELEAASLPEEFLTRANHVLRGRRAAAKQQGIRLTHVVNTAFAKLVFSRSPDR